MNSRNGCSHNDSTIIIDIGIMVVVVVVGIIIRSHRLTTYLDATYCYRLSIVVCRSATVVTPGKTAEPIEIPFGLWTQVGLRNHILNGVPYPHGKG